MSRTHIAYLYSSVKLLREGAPVKHESLGQITSCWVGQDKQGRNYMEVSRQRAQFNTKTRPEWTYLRGAARDSCSSMYKVYIELMLQSYEKEKDWDVVSYLHNSLLLLDYLFSLQPVLFIVSADRIIHSHA
jgi:hypothetical protein